MARAAPAPGMPFATLAAQVYTPVQSCLVAEVLIRLAGYALTSLADEARSFQELTVDPQVGASSSSWSPNETIRYYDNGVQICADAAACVRQQ